jgi:Tol biopolymer transport system component
LLVRIAAIIGVALVFPVVVASAESPARDFLFTADNGGRSAAFVSAQDGSDRLLVSGSVGQAFDPAWSSDGSRVAFSSTRDAAGVDPSEVYVAAADGSSLTRLTFDSSPPTAKSAPAWSPDGASIAYLADAGGQMDVWSVPVAGGTARRLTSSGGQKFGLAWSPAGGSLLTTEYQYGSTGRDIVAINAGTGAETTLAEGTGPAWSPDGSRIAYLDAAWHAAVMNADGSAPHELSDLRAGSIAWSPDGRHVDFNGTLELTSLPSTRYGPVTRMDLYTAPADASAPARRLTGAFDPLILPNALTGVPYHPAFSPDGTRIAYQVGSNRTSWVMNADGSCAQPLPALDGIQEGPYWRPGSTTGGTVDCVDLLVHVDIYSPVALGEQSPIKVTVENHGNQPAHDVVLHVSALTPSSDLQGCKSRDTPGDGCLLGTIAADGSQVAYLSVSSATAGEPGLRYSVTSTDSLLPNDDTAGSTYTTVLDCTILGTTGADHLQGTTGPDRICGMTGPDWISGGNGNDYIDGGNGNDVIFGGPGNDTILGRGGRDVIFARDGQRDWIDCGSEYDIAIVDRFDHVRNCERVLRN